MLDVLVMIELVEWLAKDMHYCTHDEWFYALHILADKIDFGTSEDDLKEAYFLGMKEMLPPPEAEIHKLALERAPQSRPHSNKELVLLLKEACTNALYAIEEAKREDGLFAGVHAIVDGGSQKRLVSKGLCWRTLEYAGRGDN